MSEVVKSLCEDWRQSDFQTIIHGDYRPNNMMFSHDAATGDPDGVKMLDFSHVCIGHPAFDFYYFLYFSTDKEFRYRVNALESHPSRI